MKLLLSLFLSSYIVVFCCLKTTQAFTEVEIRNQIDILQSSEVYLDASALDDPLSYQSKALESTVVALSDNLNSEEKHVTNFYALACLYHATYQVSNTETSFPPIWDDATNWLTESDYCSWVGITCHQEDEIECVDLFDTESLFETTLDDTDDRVVGICLSENDLSGILPVEIGLLSEYLALLAIDYNEVLVAEEPYDWFQSMTGLKQLWAGTSSFDAEGIPTNLNQLTKLEYLDIGWSYWSEGPIRSEAFTNLNNLKYIDLGDNLYDWMGDEASTVPESFVGLPSLIRLYMDNVIFTDVVTSEQHNMTLSFLTNMESIVEAWFDNTRLEGSLPVLPSTIKSLSLVNCGIWGTVSQLVTGTARLNRVWLTGNQMSGNLPLNLGGRMDCSVDLPCRLNLECNPGLAGPIPPAICRRYFNDGANGLGKFGILGADEEQCGDGGDDSCCTCIGLDCWLDEDTGEPTFTECPVFPPPPANPVPGFGSICFSGSTEVNVLHRGRVMMSELKLGDMVQVSTTDVRYEPIYSFGHKADDASAEFLQISTTSTSSKPLEISSDHMIAIEEGGRFVPASMVKKGDRLLTTTTTSNSSDNNDTVVVTNIKTITRKGVYAPFTKSGTIVVNDILASNYIAYQDSEYFQIGSIMMTTPFSYQFMAHSFNSIHRLVLLVLGKETETQETYTDQGVSHWVDVPHRMLKWVLQEEEEQSNMTTTIVSTILIGLTLVVVSMTRFMEVLLMMNCSIVTKALLLGLFLCVVTTTRRMMMKKKRNTTTGQKPTITFI